MPQFPSITHISLTVSDLPRSVAWYQALLGAEPMMDEDTGTFRHVVWMTKNFVLGLHEFPDPRKEDFDERRPGLDHISFGCADRAELKEWQARLEELGIEHSGITAAPYGSCLAFRDPDNIALEFFAPPG